MPRGETCENSTVSLTGLLKLFKEGEGTFVPAKYNQTYLGGTVVEGGVLRLYNPAAADNTAYGMRSTSALNPLGCALASSPSASEVMPIVVKTDWAAVYDGTSRNGTGNQRCWLTVDAEYGIKFNTGFVILLR